MVLSDNLRPVIQLVDNLKDCGIESKISLPRIAVIGTQSAGKSSLLESIVGMDFLPRGEGVVTRVPLELRLIHEADPDFERYAIFGDEPHIKYTNFKQITKKIEEITDQFAGSSKGIMDTPIILTIYAHECPTLTLIDLPGITRIPIENSDQTEDIEEITTEMSRKYIQDYRTIILCVIPANIDISTSDALKLARSVDKDGNRTLGVLTKVDLMDKGTSAKKTLKNENVKLTHGYVAVKNRSQADILDNVSVRDALRFEEEFFRNNEDLNEFRDLLGTKNLTEKLCYLLHDHILSCLPEIEQEILERSNEYETKLQKLGSPLPKETDQKLCFLLSKAKDIAKNVKDVIEGGELNRKEHDDRKLKGMAFFNLLISKFNDRKKKIFEDSYSTLSPGEVIIDILEKKGLALPGFLPKETIENMIRKELESLKNPIENFVYDLKDHIKEILKHIFENMSSISGSAKKHLQKYALDFLEEKEKETILYLHKTVKIEQSMIWTANQTRFLEKNQDTTKDSNFINFGFFITFNSFGTKQAKDLRFFFRNS